MDANTLNVIISLALVVAIVASSIVQLAGMLSGHPVSGIEQVVVALLGLLQAYRHAADVKNGNGSSGLTPPKDGT